MQARWDRVGREVGAVARRIPKEKRPKVVRLDIRINDKNGLTGIDVDISYIRWPLLVTPVHIASFIAGAVLGAAWRPW